MVVLFHLPLFNKRTLLCDGTPQTGIAGRSIADFFLPFSSFLLPCICEDARAFCDWDSAVIPYELNVTRL